ncbi:MAG TPA: MotA/TolQ/ExbB proton channel family protein [Elusimicrobiota bacterium]|nr:MotA/TolQ/ExbB proton channel family protein [Elusimicrobiota bacterium]
MGDIQILQMFRGSFTLVVLMFLSVLSVTFALERWWYFRGASGKSDDILGPVRKQLEGGKTDGAVAWCQKHPSAVAQVVGYGLLYAGRSRKDLEELMTSKLKEERMKLERYLAILGTLGNIAPFIGLFGTVVGIIKAFRDLAASGTGGPSVVAQGIAEALVSTAAGLIVAIPAAILYNYFMGRLKRLTVEMEVASARLIVMLGAK